MKLLEKQKKRDEGIQRAGHATWLNETWRHQLAQAESTSQTPSQGGHNSPACIVSPSTKIETITTTMTHSTTNTNTHSKPMNPDPQTNTNQPINTHHQKAASNQEAQPIPNQGAASTHTQKAIDTSQPSTAHHHETREKFMELRVLGKSYAAIAKMLGICKRTAIRWGQELSQEIAHRKALELDEWHDRYISGPKAHLQLIGAQLKKIEGAIHQGSFENISPVRLLPLFLKLFDKLKRDRESIQFDEISPALTPNPGGEQQAQQSPLPQPA